ncbi:MAG: V-type ATPase subunit subunit G family protein [Thermoplasmata archaeon]
MTQDIEVLKRIKEKEDEAKRNVEEAKKRADEIISSARGEAETIVKEAEERGSTLYQDYMREKAIETSAEVSSIKKEYEDRVAKIKKKISEEIVEKMFETVVR